MLSKVLEKLTYLPRGSDCLVQMIFNVSPSQYNDEAIFIFGLFIYRTDCKINLLAFIEQSLSLCC